MPSIDKSKLLPIIASAKQPNIELEVRIGQYENKRFKPQIDYTTYQLLNNMLRSKPYKYSHNRIVRLTQQSGKQTYRLEKNTNLLSNVLSEEKIVKERLIDYDMYSLGARLSISSEIPTNRKLDVEGVAFKIVHSYTDGNWRYDISANKFFTANNIDAVKYQLIELKNKGEDNCSELEYFAELEYIGPVIKDDSKLLDEMLTKLSVVTSFLGIEQAIISSYVISEIIKYSGNNRVYHDNTPSNVRFTDIANSVISLDRNNVTNIANDYAVTIKADGERHLIYIDDFGMIHMINSRKEATEIGTCDDRIILLDAEVVSIKGKQHILTFDLMMLHTADIMDQPFMNRYRLMNELLEKLNQTVKLDTRFHNAITPKEFLFDDAANNKTIYDQCKKVLKTPWPFTTDGLVLNAANDPYYNHSTYKWKNHLDNTIDVLVVEKERTVNDITYWVFTGATRATMAKASMAHRFGCPGHYEGSDSEYMALFPWITDKTLLFPVLFCPPDIPQLCFFRISPNDAKKHNISNHSIIELRIRDGTWDFRNNRADKTDLYRKNKSNFGNYYDVAIRVLDSIKIPITQEMITTGDMSSLTNEAGPSTINYFVADDKNRELLRPMRDYHNAIKMEMITKHLTNAALVLDVGAGRFGDLQKWIKAKIKHVIALEPNEEALTEGMGRYRSIRMDKRSGDLVVDPIVGGGADDWQKLISGEYMGNFDGINCQMVVHYLANNVNTLGQFVLNCNAALKPGGYLLLTTLNGKSVTQIMKANSIKIKQTLKISQTIGGKQHDIVRIQRLYGKQDLQPGVAGQEIMVTVESIGSAHKEYLVNIPVLIDMFERVGIKLISDKSFAELYTDDRKLSNEEKMYSFMHQRLIFRKQNKE